MNSLNLRAHLQKIQIQILPQRNVLLDRGSFSLIFQRKFKMRIFAFAFFLVPILVQAELPITTTDVFVQSGELSAESGIVMVRCNTETDSVVTVDYQTADGTANSITGNATSPTDYTVSLMLQGLTSNTTYEYTANCSPVDASATVQSENAEFTTLPGADDEKELSFVWVADLAGQGWGRNPNLTITTVDGTALNGGYVIFNTMLSTNPDFALFQGDMIYADNAIPATKDIPEEVGGGIWYNDPTKDFAAVTLDEFRANWKYNFGDERMQAFLRETPVYIQWDDHEVTNNWWPGETVGEPNYPNGTDVDEMYANSLQAFYEYNPLMDGQLIYRSQRFGRHLEVFFTDYRSYRDPNSNNSDPNGTAMMGQEQLDWLKDALVNSNATWKVISSHDPIGLVTGGDGDRDSFSQELPAVLGRELEMQELLVAIKDIENVVWLTSDVHFTAAVSYTPPCATFKDFRPFYEFVIGPVHAGAFGSQSLDGSFGPYYEYVRAPSTEGLPANLPPPNLQSFGHASVSADGEQMTVKLIDVTGEVLYEKALNRSYQPDSADICPGDVYTSTDVFVQSGELSAASGIVMVRCNSETDSVVSVEYQATDGTANSVTGNATSATDYTVSLMLEGLTSNTMYEYTANCSSVDGSTTVQSESAEFTTPPSADVEKEMSFVWVADLAGQGWGRNPELTITTIDGTMHKGGYVIFDTMLSINPDFALFQGDMIYADNAIRATKEIPVEVGGGIWVNNPIKDFSAMTLDEFRANWKYNFGDERMQAFLQETPVYIQWDDHEVTNNWWPGETVGEPNYPNGTDVDEMYANSLQAFYEYNPLMDGQLIYRSQRFGRHLEVFFTDYRSYRDPNPDNTGPSVVAMMGQEQLDWLKDALVNSNATWKVISSHDPIGLVTGGDGDRDSFSQDDPAVLGRELEMQELLVAIKDIENVVWLTSDVHFTAAVSYTPPCATFKDFGAFYEFVIGPVHAGAFGSQSLDGSFGPYYEYVRAPSTEGLPANLPPPNLQSFGFASVSADGELMTVKLIDVTGEVLYEKKLNKSYEPDSVDSCTASESRAFKLPTISLTFGIALLIPYVVRY